MSKHVCSSISSYLHLLLIEVNVQGTPTSKQQPILMVLGNCTQSGCQRLSQSPTAPLFNSPSLSMQNFSMTKRKITVKSGQKLTEVIHIVPANNVGQIQAILIAYQLLNNLLLDCFRECWLCVPSESNS